MVDSPIVPLPTGRRSYGSADGASGFSRLVRASRDWWAVDTYALGATGPIVESAQLATLQKPCGEPEEPNFVGELPAWRCPNLRPVRMVE